MEEIKIIGNQSNQLSDEPNKICAKQAKFLLNLLNLLVLLI